MKQILNYLFEHRKLTRQEAYDILIRIANNEFNECEIAAFLTIYIMRNVSVDELAGFRDALLELCVKADFSEFNTVDLCGTGGDGKNTFNISTLSSFVVAGAGIKVAKHGNYGVSSGCGSSNILEHFGYKFTNDTSVLKSQLDKSGICFLHAPLFHPAMKAIAPVRKKLGVKTFFNMLGPMVNPAFPQNQIVGVFNLELARLYNYIFQNSNSNYIIYNSLDGYDEISLTSKVKTISRKEENILSAADFGFEMIRQEEIAGGESVEESAKIFMNILEGKGTVAQNNVVLSNSALAIHCVYPEKELLECVDIAKSALIEKKALQVFTSILN